MRKVIVAGGEIDRSKVDGEIMCFISTFFKYSRRKRNMNGSFKEWNVLSKEKLSIGR